MEISSADIVAFWQDAGPERWFKRDEAFDETIRTRFGAAVEDAAAGRLDMWEATPEGTYALLLLLDQFPRNVHRGTPLAFAADPKARVVARRAIAKGFDQRIPAAERGFFYLPLMHSENLADQEQCVALYQALGDEEKLPYARDHHEIIARFGRFPHRNSILGRVTTAEEQAFLDEGGFSG